MKLDGIFPPIPTPFHEDDEISVKALKANITHWNRFALAGYVVLGSNGEFVLLSEHEKYKIIEAGRQFIPADKFLIAGSGCETTSETIRTTNKAAELGADAALVINPHYYKNRLDEQTLVHHFQSVAEEAKIPIILYNMPACSGIDLSAETVRMISEHPNVIGIKDSSGNLIKMADIRRNTDSDFQVLAGSASFLLPAMSIGAVGAIAALANIAPKICLDIYAAFHEGNLDRAQKLQLDIMALNHLVTREGGVPALKAALDLIGLSGGAVRAPLLPISAAMHHRLQQTLSELNLLV